jgi:hypothetical protein
VLSVAGHVVDSSEERSESGWRPTGVGVLDNLKVSILRSDIHHPALNPLYRDVLAHCGVVALPCRVGDPIAEARSNRASATRRSRTPAQLQTDLHVEGGSK